MRQIKNIEYTFEFKHSEAWQVAEKAAGLVMGLLQSYVGDDFEITDTVAEIDLGVYKSVWLEIVYEHGNSYVEYWGDGVYYTFDWDEQDQYVFHFGFSNMRQFSDAELKGIYEKVLVPAFTHYGNGHITPTGVVRKHITYQEVEEVIYNF